MRRSPAAALAALALLAPAALAACGGDSDPKTSIEASTPTEERLGEKVQEELEAYEVGFDLESMPQDQAAQLESIVDNLPQAAGGVHVLRVSGSVVEAETDYPDDEQGAETGKLICGAIVRAGGDDAGSQVTGEDGAVLADCEVEDADFP